MPLERTQRYLTLARGSLALANCRVDAWEYRKLTEEGLRQARNGQAWQAGNSFHRAAQLWQGEFIPKVIDHEMVQDLRDQLLRLREEAALRWTRILIRTQQRTAAIELLKAHLAENVTTPRYVRDLYRLHHAGSPIRDARRIISNY